MVFWVRSRATASRTQKRAAGASRRFRIRVSVTAMRLVVISAAMLEVYEMMRRWPVARSASSPQACVDGMPSPGLVQRAQSAGAVTPRPSTPSARVPPLPSERGVLRPQPGTGASRRRRGGGGGGRRRGPGGGRRGRATRRQSQAPCAHSGSRTAQGSRRGGRRAGGRGRKPSCARRERAGARPAGPARAPGRRREG